MKRFSSILVLLFFALSIYAQKEVKKRNDELKSLLVKNEKRELGWVFGIEQGYMQVKNRDLSIGGMSAGMIINHNFIIGTAGHAWNIKNGIELPEVTDTARVNLNGGYGGLLLAYVLKPKSPVNVTFSILLAGGGALYQTEKEYTKWVSGKAKTYHKTIDSDVFYVIEPAASVHVSLFKFLRLKAGIGYCYAADVQLMRTCSDLMNNFTASVGLEIGKF